MSMDETKYPPQPHEVECVMPGDAEFMARCFVNGTEWHDKMKRMEPMSGMWSERFRGHPWVIEARRYGWTRELQAAVVQLVKRAILFGVKPKDIEIEKVMPQGDLVAYWRRQAAIAREAAVWRAQNPEDPAIRGLVPIDVEAMLRRMRERNSNQETTQ